MVPHAKTGLKLRPLREDERLLVVNRGEHPIMGTILWMLTEDHDLFECSQSWVIYAMRPGS